MLLRRHFIATSAALLSAMGSGTAASAVCAEWPEWVVFRDKFIQADGRVIDFAADGHSTSEGQVYSLFFALVANDRASFDRVLNWTRVNLAGGDFTAVLLAWQWGKRRDGSWGVLDANAASDADLWLAYVLYQAASHWRDASLRANAELVQNRIAKELVIQVAGIGSILLPGQQGFVLQSGGWKLNPSYLPLQVLRGLSKEAPHGPWDALLHSTLAMLETTTPQGLVADWVALRPGRGFVLDSEVGLSGSHDAIRVYLWAGMLSRQDSERVRLLARLNGMTQLVDRQLVPPEKIDAISGNSEGSGTAGFSAALLPFLDATGLRKSADRQRARIIALGGIPANYYDQVLGLFALGWTAKRFYFERDGSLTLPKTAKCKK